MRRKSCRHNRHWLHLKFEDTARLSAKPSSHPDGNARAFTRWSAAETEGYRCAFAWQIPSPALFIRHQGENRSNQFSAAIQNWSPAPKTWQCKFTVFPRAAREHYWKERLRMARFPFNERYSVAALYIVLVMVTTWRRFMHLYVLYVQVYLLVICEIKQANHQYWYVTISKQLEA